MVYAVILGILFGAGAFACGGIAIWGAMDEGTVRKCVGGILCPILFILFLCIPFSFHVVDAGEVAVVKHMGTVSAIRTSGTYFDFWMTESYERYDAKVQTLEIQESAYSSDKQTMDIQMTVQYQIMPEKAGELAQTYGSLDTLSNRIRSVAIERAKAELSKHSADNIIENRASMSPTVQTVVQEAISESYYVTINAVVLTNIDFSDAYEKIVEETMMAKQEETKAQYEKSVAIINAEKELEVAKLAAEAKLYAAQQEAEAQKAIALAEAVSTVSKIAKLAQSLGFEVNEVYQKTAEFTEKLDEDGKVVLDEDGEPIMIATGNLINTDVVVGYTVNWQTAEGEGGLDTILSYIKYLEYLSTWNGDLPDVVAGDNGFMITVPTTGDNT